MARRGVDAPGVDREAAGAHHDELAAGTALSAPVIVNLANRLVHWTDVEQGVFAPEAEAVLPAAAGLTFGGVRRDRRAVARSKRTTSGFSTGPTECHEPSLSRGGRRRSGSVRHAADASVADPGSHAARAERVIVRGVRHAARRLSRDAPRARAGGGRHRPRRRPTRRSPAATAWANASAARPRRCRPSCSRSRATSCTSGRCCAGAATASGKDDHCRPGSKAR